MAYFKLKVIEIRVPADASQCETMSKFEQAAGKGEHSLEVQIMIRVNFELLWSALLAFEAERFCSKDDYYFDNDVQSFAGKFRL